MTRNYFDLTGQVAVVTGCSTGLGVQMAKALASQGCNIAALARRKDKIDAVAAEIEKEFGVKAVGIQCDITSTEMVDAAIDETLKVFGRIDILINNAGTGAVAPAEDITDDQFNDEMNIDLFGTFRVARSVAKKAIRSAEALPITLQRAELSTSPEHLLPSGEPRASQLMLSAPDTSTPTLP